MPSEDALRRGAVASFTNAQELYEEAKLLFEQGHPPRSVALALIGAEAFAKAVVLTVAALLPKQRRRLPWRLNCLILGRSWSDIHHSLNTRTYSVREPLPHGVI
jgi:hypothetical protein